MSARKFSGAGLDATAAKSAHEGRRQKTAPDLLRAIVSLMNMNAEGFNLSYSAYELLLIFECQINSVEWDVMPDEWEYRQVLELLESGKVPQFKDVDGATVAHYPRKRAK